MEAKQLALQDAIRGTAMQGKPIVSKPDNRSNEPLSGLLEKM
jgi:hypothetical protein